MNNPPELAALSGNLRGIFYRIFTGFAGLLVSVGVSSAAEPVLPPSANTNLMSQNNMTPVRFKEIVALPGDAKPLLPKLAAVPVWTNAVVSVVLKYESGETFTEDVPQTAKTVGGKYIVFTAESKFYHQTMYSILTYDEKSSALKVYGLYGDMVTEGTVVYDYDKKTYTESSSYGDGFKEVTTGIILPAEHSDRTLVYRNGILFMTRETKCHPVDPPKISSK
jgi:hypothetical protein